MVLMAFFLALCVGVLTTPIILHLSHKRGWYDSVDHRKIHTGAVPRLGGVAMSIAFLSVLILVAVHYGLSRNLVLFTLGVMVVHLVGVVDDFKNLPALLKLVVQIVGATLVALSGLGVQGIHIPFTSLWLNFGFLTLPLAIFWIISISNAINLIDGMDGLAGTVSLIAALSYGLIHLLTGNEPGAILSFAIAGAICAFLLFNRPKASLFMGDGGAYLLGIILSSLPFVSPAALTDTALPLLDQLHLFVVPSIMVPARMPPIDAVVAVIILLVPVSDMLAAILRRLRKGVPLHTPDREHLHHKLLDFGLTVWPILGVIAVVSVVFSFLAIMMVMVRTQSDSNTLVLNGCIVIGAGVLAITLFTVLHFKNSKRKQIKSI